MSTVERVIGDATVTIHTEFVFPPIPTRECDWQAVTDDFDADWDGEGYVSSHPVGYGLTEQEAIEDLCAQIQERAEEKA